MSGGNYQSLQSLARPLLDFISQLWRKTGWEWPGDEASNYHLSTQSYTTGLQCCFSIGFVLLV